MTKFKLLIGDKGKTYTKEVSDEQSGSLMGLKIGATFKGDLVGLGGYELEITGGSDSDGFPMRRGYHGTSSRRLILSPGVGFKSNVKGKKKKKRVRGDTISEKISQINTKVVTAGPQPLEKVLAPAEKAEGEEGEAKEGEAKAQEAPKPEKPAEAKQKEKKPEEKPAETPAPEEKKEGD